MDIEKIFDPPWPPPTVEKPFRPFPEAYIAGPVPASFRTKTVRELAAALFKVSGELAAELVEFGAVWLDDRPRFDPDGALADCRAFRLNPPVYGPVRFYEADPARVVYEDRDILVYNKESGRPSQAVPHDAYNNVLSACGRLLAARGDRPGLWLLHRLDADTSGLLMMAKNKTAAGILGRAFQDGLVSKEYICQGLGGPPPAKDFEVEAPIAKDGRRYVVRPGGPGLAAKTSFSVLAADGSADREAPEVSGRQKVLFLARPLTGRTHQIRLHLAWAGWPIIGDRFYGPPEEAATASRLRLASAGLGFAHPADGRRLELRLDY